MQTTASPLDINVGARVTVTTADGYQQTGVMLGLAMASGSSKIRLKGRDGLEYWIPAAGSTVTA